MKRSRKSQIDLFGAAASSSSSPNDSDAVDSRTQRSRDDVLPAVVDKSLHELAARLPDEMRLGTSSWAFPGWQSLVYGGEYPTNLLSRRGLHAYAQHPLLRAVGLDRTFYAPISERAFAEYAQLVPPDFRFLVKAHAAITTPRGMRVAGHAPPVDRFLDAGYATQEIIAPAVQGLGDRLGVILFQFPPLALSAAKLEALPAAIARFLQALPPGIPYAIEVRNAALLGRPYSGALAAGGATHCFTVHPTMPGVPAQLDALRGVIPGEGPVVIRWMLGHGREYAEARDAYAPFDRLAAPDLESRADIAALVQHLNTAHRPVLVIANNKAEGSAPRTLTELARLVAGSGL